MAYNLGQVGVFYSGTTAPSNTKLLWYKTDNEQWYSYISSSWVCFSDGGDGKVKVSGGDTGDYLENKIICDDPYLTITKTGGIGDEQLTLSFDNISLSDIGKVKVDSQDGLEYLESKFEDSNDILFQSGGGAGDAHLTALLSSGYTVKTDATDTPEYLENKIVGTNGIEISTEGGVGDSYIQISMSAKTYEDLGKVMVDSQDSKEYLDSKFEDSNDILFQSGGGAGDAHLTALLASGYTVKVDTQDTPSFLEDKINSGDALIEVNTTGAAGDSFVTITFPNGIYTGKTMVDSQDTPEYLENKIVGKNGIEVKPGGGAGDAHMQISLTGLTTRYISVPILNFSSGLTAFQGSYLYNFSKVVVSDPTAYFSFKLPHNYKEDSNIKLKLNSTSASAGSGNVKYKYTYSWQNIAGTYVGETSGNTIIAYSSAYRHKNDEIIEISGTSKDRNSIVVCSLSRQSNDILDTLTTDVLILDINFEIITDSL